MDKFPLLSLTVRYGNRAAIALAAIVALLLLWAGPAQPALAGALAVAGAAVTFVAVRSYVELVVLVTDMLLPR